jgi:hypothetical protein
MNSEISSFPTEKDFVSIILILIFLFGILGLVIILNYKMKKRRARNYLTHISNIGIRAEVQKLDFSPLSTDLKKSDANAIKIFGLNIDYIIVTTHYNEPYFLFNYVASRSVESMNDWAIKTVFETVGSLNKRITGFAWKVDEKKEDELHPNRLLGLLSKDNNLNKYLLKRFQSGMPEITISPFKEEPVNGIGLRLRFESFKKGTYYSSRKDIEVFDTITKYIKEI